MAQPLIAQPEHYVGVSTMAAKQLALTFDDGPGPRTSELSTYLKDQNVRATFFVNGACIQATALPNQSCPTPLPNAVTVLAQLAADGHLVANHSTTHRDITTVPANQRVQELADTDALITLHAKTPYNRSLFRAPYGSWSAAVHTTLAASAMAHYVGPIYWDIGGGPTDATRAADWECWQTFHYTAQACGDRYRTEIASFGRGIVLMHDVYDETIEMVKYIVPLLKNDGYTFIRADDVPRIAADFPACGPAACSTCSGPGADACTACTSGHYLSAGTCAACSTCADGTYKSADCAATTDTVCAACDPSCTTCSGPGPSDCGTCPSGSFRSDDGACRACTACAPGTYASTACAANADTVCEPCPAGTYSSAPGASSCTQCGSCDDGDRCTADSCSATGGCAHAPIPGCVSSDASAQIDEGPEPNGIRDEERSGCSASGRTVSGSAASALAIAALLGLRRRRLARARS